MICTLSLDDKASLEINNLKKRLLKDFPLASSLSFLPEVYLSKESLRENLKDLPTTLTLSGIKTSIINNKRISFLKIENPNLFLQNLESNYEDLPIIKGIPLYIEDENINLDFSISSNYLIYKEFDIKIYNKSIAYYEIFRRIIRRSL